MAEIAEIAEIAAGRDTGQHVQLRSQDGPRQVEREVDFVEPPVLLVEHPETVLDDHHQRQRRDHQFVAVRPYESARHFIQFRSVALPCVALRFFFFFFFFSGFISILR